MRRLFHQPHAFMYVNINNNKQHIFVKLRLKKPRVFEVFKGNLAIDSEVTMVTLLFILAKNIGAQCGRAQA